MKQLRLLLSPLDGMLVHLRVVNLQQYVTSIHFIHLGGERQCGVKFLVYKETTRLQGPGVEPSSFRSEVQPANHYATMPPQNKDTPLTWTPPFLILLKLLSCPDPIWVSMCYSLQVNPLPHVTIATS